jgi:ribosome-binding factor A
MPKKHRKESLEQLIKDLSATFFARESSKKSLLTVTRVLVSEDLRNAIVYISVFPEKEEIAALHFAKRQRKELQEYLRETMKRQFIPFVDVDLDKGEKLLNRMRDLGV